MFLWALVQSLINGILMGGTYALLAVGTTIIFGVMRMINFASGAFIMAGMYLTWWIFQFLGWEIYALLPVVIVFIGLLSYICFKLAISKVMTRDRASVIIVTIGLMDVLQNTALILFGATPLNVPSKLSSSFLVIGDFTFSWIRLIAFFIAVVFTVIVSLFINKTSYGRCMRATAENEEIAQLLGVNTKFIYVSSWVLGIILTGVAGVVMSPLYNVTPAVGGVFRSTALIAVVLGGMGNLKGAFISGIALGIIEALVSVFIAPELGPAGMFLLFLIVLRFKPQGLFGKGERIA